MKRRRRLSAKRLDRLVSSAASVRDEELAGLVDGRVANELFDSIVDDRLDGEAVIRRLPRMRAPRERLLVGAAAAMLLVAAVLSVALVFRGPGSGRASAMESVALSTKSGAQFEADLPNNALNGALVDWDQVPAYVTVIYAGSAVGVVKSSDLESAGATTGAPSGATGEACGTGGIDVYSTDRTTIVGHLYPLAGYVPNGQTPSCDLSPTTSLPTRPANDCPLILQVAGQVQVRQCGTNNGS